MSAANENNIAQAERSWRKAVLTELQEIRKLLERIANSQGPR